MGRLTILLSVLFFGTILSAQETPHIKQADLPQQIAVGGGIVVARKTTVNGVKYEPTTAGAYEVSYRYRILKHVSVQADYDLFMNTQKYLVGSKLTSIGSDVHAATGSAVITFGNPLSKRFESFITVGGGALIFVPRNEGSLASQTVNQFSVGGGDDYRLTHNLRIRAEVKGLTYKAPDFGLTSIHTTKLVDSVIPTLGIVYTF